MEIVELSQRPHILNEAIDYFWRCWGNETNFKFYQDCILHSINIEPSLPRFYLALADSKIAGSYALLPNDLISRQDLIPWLACLFVTQEFRNQGLAGKLLDHGLTQAASKGYQNLFLYTDLKNFYERKGWSYYTGGFNPEGREVKIYWRKTKYE